MGQRKAQIADKCPACGGPVECGVSSGSETCWCFALPHALPMPPQESGVRCYCPRCLQRRIDDRTRAGTSLRTVTFRSSSSNCWPNWIGWLGTGADFGLPRFPRTERDGSSADTSTPRLDRW